MNERIQQMFGHLLEDPHITLRDIIDHFATDEQLIELISINEFTIYAIKQPTEQMKRLHQLKWVL